MNFTSQAKEAQDRTIAVFTARPAHALSTLHGVAVLEDGFACTYEQDGYIVHADMPAAIGGGGRAPTPGFYGRAAICTCLVIGIQMAAIHEDIAITSLKVSIDQDWDNRGLFAIGDVTAGPLDTRLAILVESPSPAAVVEGLVNRAMASDPWLLAFKDSQKVTAALSVLKSTI